MSGRGPGLRGKLLVLLLAFGVLPVVAAILGGFVVSRTVLTRQVLGSLQALTEAQAIHLATELDRERLLLRTIAGQLPPALDPPRPEAVLGQLLIQGLPENGVFDGLRLVTPGGRILAPVALRNTAPHWPDEAPAADWTGRQVVVHRDGAEVLAYLLAVPVATADSAVWLEGHVRVEDFARVLSIPEPLLAGARSAVLDSGGRLVFGSQSERAGEMVRLLPAGWLAREGGGGAGAAETDRALVAVARVAGTDWRFASAVPLAVALAPLARLRDFALAALALLGVVIVLIGVLAARSVTSPLRALAAAALRFGREGGGGQPISVPVRGSDEVGVVMASFNAMAEALRRSREELEMLHARDLERAQQLVTVGELASGVAHEIRNPLTGVRGALELAMGNLPAGAASRPLLEEAQQQLTRIETTTTQLLRYARPPELRVIVTDANLLAERAATIVAPRAAAAGVAIRREAAPAVPVTVDPELMVQVLVNLLLNAMDASPAGGEVSVWVARRASDAWITVQDAGPGVPESARADIFRPFFTTKHRGTGLGLSISRQIVTRHLGTLRLEDTPGGGATFVVALPLAPEGGGEPA